MPTVVLPLASDFQTAATLSLVIPLAVFIVVTIWYVTLWRRRAGER